MNKGGFTLIEVMVALGILALSLGALSIRQTQILKSVTEMESLSIATMLARQKMAEIEIEFRMPFSEIKEKENGDFGEQYPGYTWEKIVEEFEMNIPIPKEEMEDGVELSYEVFTQKLSEIMSEHVRQVRLTVYYSILGKEREIEIVTHFVDLKKDINVSI